MRIFNKLKNAFSLSLILIGSISLWSQSHYLQQVNFTSVKITDQFWAPRMKTNHEVTIPISFAKSEETGRIKNFKVAAKLEPGAFCSTYPYDDSDVFKIIEGASYSLQLFPDPLLEAKLDTLISYIAQAQEPDGYLYTNRTIDSLHMHPWVGKKRWENDPKSSHELYNVGHLYEAAVAHYLATGKTTLLQVAIKNADLVAHDFLDKRLPYYPGHQEIELGLVKLYKVTGNERYLDLAKYFLDIRKGGKEYNQAHLPVSQQSEIVGHAVRATYMYSAMADVAALKSAPEYQAAILKIWNDLIDGKYYITGGIGSQASNEGFGKAYELPNEEAYCETCASIGNVLWNYRMFLMDADGKYYDVLERTLYNALLSGVSLSGDRFFYPNPLESHGQHERQAWFDCACCPSNICRFLPSVPGYIYAMDSSIVYVNLFIQNEAALQVGNHLTHFELSTKYPWEGKVIIRIKDSNPLPFTIAIRIPGWARGEAVPSNLYEFTDDNVSPWKLKVNNKNYPFEFSKGYVFIHKTWNSGDKIELELPMEVQTIKAHPAVKADSGKIALQRGPLVYCLEWTDQPNIDLWNIAINRQKGFKIYSDNSLLPGCFNIQGEACRLDNSKANDCFEFKAIPYFLWAHRGKGSMRVWMPYLASHE